MDAFARFLAVAEWVNSVGVKTCAGDWPPLSQKALSPKESRSPTVTSGSIRAGAVCSKLLGGIRSLLAYIHSPPQVYLSRSP